MNILSKKTFRWWDINAYRAIYDSSKPLKPQMEDQYEGRIHLTEQTLLPNLMVELEIYKTTSEAMRAGFKGKIPSYEYVYYKVPKHGYKKRFYCAVSDVKPTFNLLSFLRLAKWYLSRNK